jgi:hypothetical protein
MYPQARVFIKTALVYLAISFGVGALMLANQSLALDARLGGLTPVFYHLLMVGWTTQLICGVALWLFPPLSREQPRGDQRLGWATYALLNAGLLLRAVAEPLHAIRASAPTGWALVISGVLQAAGVWVFVFAIWPRVKGKPGPAVREKRARSTPAPATETMPCHD